MQGVEIRLATLADAEAGAEAHRACWREAYAAYVDPALLETRLADAAEWTRRWREQLAAGSPRTLAIVGGEVVGFASAGPARGEDPPADLGLYALYTRADWWGSGLGHALLDEVSPSGPCFLWVLSENARARRFYGRRGFTADGATEHYAGLDADEVRMVRRA